MTLGRALTALALVGVNLAALRTLAQGLPGRLAVLGLAFGMLSLAAWRAATRRGRSRAAVLGYVLVGGVFTATWIAALFARPSTRFVLPSGAVQWADGPILATLWRRYSLAAQVRLGSMLPAAMRGREWVAVGLAAAVALAPQLAGGGLGALAGWLIQGRRERAPRRDDGGGAS